MQISQPSVGLITENDLMCLSCGAAIVGAVREDER
jgi:hypothetical protein